MATLTLSDTLCVDDLRAAEWAGHYKLRQKRLAALAALDPQQEK